MKTNNYKINYLLYISLRSCRNILKLDHEGISMTIAEDISIHSSLYNFSKHLYFSHYKCTFPQRTFLSNSKF